VLGHEGDHLCVLDPGLRARTFATNRVTHGGDPLHIGGETQLDHQQ